MFSLQGSIIYLNISQCMEVRNINVRFVFTYKYETCDAQFTVRSNLSTHIKSQHQGVKYPCGLCDYHLSTHVDCVIIIYLDITKLFINHADQMTKLNWTDCDFQTVFKSCLAMHKKKKHWLLDMIKHNKSIQDENKNVRHIIFILAFLVLSCFSWVY